MLIGGGLIYFFSTAKQRRNDAVEVRVERMIEGGRTLVTFSDLYFDAAKSYAISKGAHAPDQDVASTRMLVKGRVYFVVFMREIGQGTTISVSDR